MDILRAIAGIIVGYLVFAVGSMLLISPVMSQEGPVIIVVALVALAVIGLIAGWLATAVGGKHARLVVCVVAGLVALATIANLVMKLGAEPDWYKVGTLLLTAPAILLVGLRATGKKTTG